MYLQGMLRVDMMSVHYLPEVFNTGYSSERSTTSMGRIKEQITHHLCIVVHCGTCHSKCH